MKNFRLLAIAVIASITLASCSDDDAPAQVVPVIEEVVSAAQFNGETIDLPVATVFTQPSSSSSRSVSQGNYAYLTLSSEAVESYTGISSSSFEGKDALELYMEFEGEFSSISEGTYFLGNGGSYQLTDLGLGIFEGYFNTASGEKYTTYLGTFKVSKDGDTYTFEYDLLLVGENGSYNLTGTYKGELSVKEAEEAEESEDTGDEGYY